MSQIPGKLATAQDFFGSGEVDEVHQDGIFSQIDFMPALRENQEPAIL